MKLKPCKKTVNKPIEELDIRCINDDYIKAILSSLEFMLKKGRLNGVIGLAGSEYNFFYDFVKKDEIPSRIFKRD